MPEMQSRASVRTVEMKTLCEGIELVCDDLRRGIEVLIWRMGEQLRLPRKREDITALAEEVLQEAVARALDRAEHFDPSRSVHAWLLGIATNILREYRRHDMQEQRRHSYHTLDSVADAADGETYGESLTRMYDMATLEWEHVQELLDLVSPSDQIVLTYRFVHNLRGDELAAALGIKPGAARVRLSRAIARLSSEYHRAERAGKEDQ